MSNAKTPAHFLFSNSEQAAELQSGLYRAVVVVGVAGKRSKWPDVTSEILWHEAFSETEWDAAEQWRSSELTLTETQAIFSALKPRDTRARKFIRISVVRSDMLYVAQELNKNPVLDTYNVWLLRVIIDARPANERPVVETIQVGSSLLWNKNHNSILFDNVSDAARSLLKMYRAMRLALSAHGLPYNANAVRMHVRSDGGYSDFRLVAHGADVSVYATRRIEDNPHSAIVVNKHHTDNGDGSFVA